MPEGAEPWLVNLIELKNKTDISLKQIAEAENLAEKSVSNVFFGKSKNPGVDLIRRIIHALGGTWSEIFGESGAVIGGQGLTELQEAVDRLKADLATASAELAILKTTNAALTAENDFLRSKIEHKDEIIAHKEKIISLYNQIDKLHEQR